MENKITIQLTDLESKNVQTIIDSLNQLQSQSKAIKDLHTDKISTLKLICSILNKSEIENITNIDLNKCVLTISV